jgi:pilus assembly protein Flp/PilA
MKRLIMNFLKDETGQDLVEYGLLLTFVAVAGVATMTTLGTTISGVFTTVTGKL